MAPPTWPPTTPPWLTPPSSPAGSPLPPSPKTATPLSWLGSASLGASWGMVFGATISLGGGGFSSLRIFCSGRTTGAAAAGACGFASTTGGGAGGGSFTIF